MIIMTLTDLGNHEIKKSKNCKNYVYIFHALVSTRKCYTHTAFDNYDIILCNGEYQEKELRLCEKLFNLKEKKIYNTGYLYFEKLLEERKRLAQKDTKKKILFAVSGIKIEIIYLIIMQKISLKISGSKLSSCFKNSPGSVKGLIKL